MCACRISVDCIVHMIDLVSASGRCQKIFKKILLMSQDVMLGHEPTTKNIGDKKDRTHTKGEIALEGHILTLPLNKCLGHWPQMCCLCRTKMFWGTALVAMSAT